jgi:shikimate kinase
MTDLNHLVEQHIREHEARSRHIDALAERVRNKVAEAAEHKDMQAQLDELMAERDKLMVRVNEFKLKSPDEWREEEIARSSLMGIWDALAQQLEKLVERLER